MANINANIVVEPIDITIQQNSPGITVTPTPLNLNIITGGTGGNPGGNFLTVQFNDNGILDGIPFTEYVNGNLVLGNISNLKITGGTIAYYLQTDGAGNLTWAQGAGNVTGNGSSAGSNNAIQISTGNGSFKAASGFNFDTASNIFGAPGNINVGGEATITGNIIAGNSVTANYFIGNISSSNVIGSVANANYANVSNLAITANTANISNLAIVANTVSNNVQSNITSLGNLTNLNIIGTTSLQQVKEKANIGSPISGNITINVLDQVVYLYPNDATANWFFLVQGNANTTFSSITNVGESITFTVINKNGANGYFGNRIYIDGSLAGVNWLKGGTTGAPTSGTTNGFDVYTFNIFKTSTVPTAYTVFGSKIGFSVT